MSEITNTEILTTDGIPLKESLKKGTELSSKIIQKIGARI